MSSYTWSEYPRTSFSNSLVQIKQHDMSKNVITTMPVRTTVTTVSEYNIRQISSYALNWPLRVRVKPVEGMYVAIEDEFDLWSDGETEIDAIEGVKSFFLQVLKRYLETPDDRLELLARREKKQYIAITERP